MPRILIATVAGFVGLAFYIMNVVATADRLGSTCWALQFAYFLVAGLLWVLPIRWLMLWAARKR